MFHIVGRTTDCKRLAVCHTEQQAAAYIEMLPGYERGLYYIDSVSSAHGPVVLAVVLAPVKA